MRDSQERGGFDPRKLSPKQIQSQEQDIEGEHHYQDPESNFQQQSLQFQQELQRSATKTKAKGLKIIIDNEQDQANSASNIHQLQMAKQPEDPTNGRVNETRSINSFKIQRRVVQKQSTLLKNPYLPSPTLDSNQAVGGKMNYSASSVTEENEISNQQTPDSSNNNSPMLPPSLFKNKSTHANVEIRNKLAPQRGREDEKESRTSKHAKKSKGSKQKHQSQNTHQTHNTRGGYQSSKQNHTSQSHFELDEVENMNALMQRIKQIKKIGMERQQRNILDQVPSRNGDTQVRESSLASKRGELKQIFSPANRMVEGSKTTKNGAQKSSLFGQQAGKDNEIETKAQILLAQSNLGSGTIGGLPIVNGDGKIGSTVSTLFNKRQQMLELKRKKTLRQKSSMNMGKASSTDVTRLQIHTMHPSNMSNNGGQGQNTSIVQSPSIANDLRLQKGDGSNKNKGKDEHFIGGLGSEYIDYDDLINVDENQLQKLYGKNNKQGCLSRLFSKFSSKGRISDYQIQGVEPEEDYELDQTNENDYADYPDLLTMTPDERSQRILELWSRAFKKAKGAALILSTFESLRIKIHTFGRQLLVNSKKKQDEVFVLQKSCPYIIMPQSTFKLIWNFVIIILLLYTATYMPYRICYITQSSTGFLLVFDYLNDVLFGLDILINFISALELPDGSVDPRISEIAKAYFKSWFLLDICATFPTGIFDNSSSSDDSSDSTDPTLPSSSTSTSGSSSSSSQNSSSYNKLLRLARLPRLYRLIRIVRLFKIVKILRYNATIQRIFDRVKMNAAISRMIFTLIFAFFSVHLMSCFWYLISSLQSNDPDTWVSRLNLSDADPPTLYLESMYWSLQTVATVGYGDFGAFTTGELFLSIIWMIFGVGFYSFVIGNLTSIIANENANSENLYNKLKALEEFAKKTSLPEELHFKIRQFLENNYNELFSRIDENQLLQELPITLRDEVFIHKYQGLLDTIEFLRDCENNEFVWAMVQLLRKMKVDSDDVIYQEEDLAEEIYYIKIGKVRLYAHNGYPFATYTVGQHFGDNEVIFKETRDGKAVAQTDCQFYALHKDDLEKLVEQHEDMRFVIYDAAKQKREQHMKLKDQVLRVQPVYGQNQITAQGHSNQQTSNHVGQTLPQTQGQNSGNVSARAANGGVAGAFGSLLGQEPSSPLKPGQHAQGSNSAQKNPNSFIRQTVLQKFGMDQKGEKGSRRDLKLDFHPLELEAHQNDNLAQNSVSSVRSKAKSRKGSFSLKRLGGQTNKNNENNYKINIRDSEDEITTIPGSQLVSGSELNQRPRGQSVGSKFKQLHSKSKNHINQKLSQGVEENETLSRRKKKRLESILQNVDSEPHFTKNVNKLLESQQMMISQQNRESPQSQRNDIMERIASDMRAAGSLPPRPRDMRDAYLNLGEPRRNNELRNNRRADRESESYNDQMNSDYEVNARRDRSSTLQENKKYASQDRQKQIEELKQQFQQKNKVSTIESYEKKKGDNFKVSQTVEETQQLTIKEIIEQDECLGDPDAEEALESLARFNEDMSMIALNVYQVYNLFDLIGKENEEIISWMHSLEKQTVVSEERQSAIESRIDRLIMNTDQSTSPRSQFKNQSTLQQNFNGPYHMF